MVAPPADTTRAETDSQQSEHDAHAGSCGWHALTGSGDAHRDARAALYACIT